MISSKVGCKVEVGGKVEVSGEVLDEVEVGNEVEVGGEVEVDREVEVGGEIEMDRKVEVDSGVEVDKELPTPWVLLLVCPVPFELLLLFLEWCEAPNSTPMAVAMMTRGTTTIPMIPLFIRYHGTRLLTTSYTFVVVGSSLRS
jgi:hypothetical protein